MFSTGSAEAWLKFQRTLQKIIKSQNLKTGPQVYFMTNNLLVGETSCVLEHKAKEKVHGNKENFDLVIEGPTTHFFRPRALQRQNRYLLRGLFNPQVINMHKFIFCVKEITNCLEDFPLFGDNQVLPGDEILELVEFRLHYKCKK